MRIDKFLTAAATNKNRVLSWFALLWSLVLILPLVYFPLPSVNFGHPWKVEAAISLLLGLTLIGLTQQTSRNAKVLSPALINYVFLPGVLFTCWSAVSALWAESLNSAVHHTLVWFCYLTFFVFALRIAANRKLLILSLASCGALIGAIALICVTEFAFSSQITEVYGFRYGRFAEMQATALPLLLSLVLKSKRKHLIFAVVITGAAWLAVLVSLSRGAFIAAIIGLALFIALRLLASPSKAELKRLGAAVTLIILFAAAAQLPFANFKSNNMTARLSVSESSDRTNSVSTNIRFLFGGVAWEMFRANPLIGAGADNFGLEFNRYRAVFSENPLNQPAASQREDLLPERAHNEYLQILAELGIIGGSLFAAFLIGIGRLELAALKSRSADALNHAALAGITAFLISSLFSSFSFRLMQNGLVFFFLLAILLRGYAAVNKQSAAQREFSFHPPRQLIVTAATVLCFALTATAMLRGASLYFTHQAERQSDFAAAERYLQTAKQLDDSNAGANFIYGEQLVQANEFEKAAEELQKSVSKGLNTSGSYSYLISAQILANQTDAAAQTAAEAVCIYPYSVFARTRYADVLLKLNRAPEAATQLAIARRLNEKQAATWQLLIAEGGIKVAEQSRLNIGILDINLLIPNESVYAILTERRKTHPEEDMKFAE